MAASTHDDAHITLNLKRKREDFLHSIQLTDQLLVSYEELLTSSGVRHFSLSLSAIVLGLCVLKAYLSLGLILLTKDLVFVGE